MDSLFELKAVVVSFILLILCFWWLNGKTSRCRSSSTSKNKEAPEPAGAWPLIGHLHLLVGHEQLLYRTLGALADKYGPAFNIRLGVRPAFVVSSWEIAKECFTINDKAFVSRPTVVASKLLGYNSSVFGFSPYGPFWREMRKIATVELLSNRRLEMLKHVRVSEVEMSIRELYNLWILKNGKNSIGSRVDEPVQVELKRWFEDLMLNVVVRMVASKRFFDASKGNNGSDVDDDDEARRWQKAIGQFFQLSGVFVVSDVLPFLGWLDWQGYKSAMKRTAKEIYSIIGRWLEEHRRKRLLVNGTGAMAEAQQDFMDVMLSLEEEGHLSNFEHTPDTCIKSTSLALISGGSESTAGTLTWAVSLLFNNPHVLTKAQEELDLQIGKERQVEESDIKNLVYLQAIMKETLRLYPAGPLLGPREAIEDCTVAGFNVRAGTRLVVNIWKVQRDPRVWPDPSKFSPERFLTSHVDVDVRGQSFELMPFGSGRRSCPGASFALQVMHLTLARLLHSFEMGTPSGAPVDMTETPGLVISKATPLEVLLTPRLPPDLY